MNKLERGLIVSCQACEGEPLYGYNIMHLFAKAAIEGGAVGIRALLPDIPAIKAMVKVPVIGLTKKNIPGCDVYITPTLDEVKKLLQTECEVIAMDATSRPRPHGELLEDIVAYIKTNAPQREIMADVADLNDVDRAVELGFDYVSTTLRGYTQGTKGRPLPDMEFMQQVKEHLVNTNTKMIAEGGLFEVGQMEIVNSIDPYAVVVGSAITRPSVITKRLAAVFNGN